MTAGKCPSRQGCAGCCAWLLAVGVTEQESGCGFAAACLCAAVVGTESGTSERISHWDLETLR